jgi:hypothetical protein
MTEVKCRTLMMGIVAVMMAAPFLAALAQDAATTANSQRTSVG